MAPASAAVKGSSPAPVSNAFAMGGGAGGSVDPRTGAFQAQLPLVNVADPDGTGLSLAASYSQSLALQGAATANRFGLGAGWSIGLPWVDTAGGVRVYPASGGSYAWDTSTTDGVGPVPAPGPEVHQGSQPGPLYLSRRRPRPLDPYLPGRHDGSVRRLREPDRADRPVRQLDRPDLEPVRAAVASDVGHRQLRAGLQVRLERFQSDQDHRRRPPPRRSRLRSRSTSATACSTPSPTPLVSRPASATFRRPGSPPRCVCCTRWCLRPGRPPASPTGTVLPAAEPGRDRGRRRDHHRCVGSRSAGPGDLQHQPDR